MSNIFGKSNTAVTLNVTNQSDFDEDDNSSVAFIKNRPVVGDGGLTEKNFTSGFNDKLTAISNNADVNVQSDFNQTDTTADDYIRNPPVVASETAAGLIKIGYTGSGKNYPVLLASEKAYVSVPWDNKLTTNEVQTAMNTIIEKQETTNNTLIKINGTTKMTLSDTLASFTTTELAGDTLVCDTTLRSNQATTATSGDFLLQRNTTEKLRFGNALTTINDNTFFKGKVCISNETTSVNVVPLYIPYGLSPNIDDDNSPFRQFRYNTGNNLKDEDSSANAGDGQFAQYQQACSIYALKNIICGSFFVAMTSSFNGSDDRIKSEETPIENATETLLKITAKNYYKHPTYRVSEENEAPIPENDLSGNVIRKEWESGVIAQEVLGVSELSHLVNESIDPITSQDTLIMNYTGLIPYLIKSNQELHERIKQLEIKSNV